MSGKCFQENVMSGKCVQETEPEPVILIVSTYSNNNLEKSIERS